MTTAAGHKNTPCRLSICYFKVIFQSNKISLHSNTHKVEKIHKYKEKPLRVYAWFCLLRLIYHNYWLYMRTWLRMCDVPHRKWFTYGYNRMKLIDVPFLHDTDTAKLEPDVVSTRWLVWVNVSIATTFVNQDWAFWKPTPLPHEHRHGRICQSNVWNVRRETTNFYWDIDWPVFNLINLHYG